EAKLERRQLQRPRFPGGERVRQREPLPAALDRLGRLDPAPCVLDVAGDGERVGPLEPGAGRDDDPERSVEDVADGDRVRRDGDADLLGGGAGRGEQRQRGEGGEPRRAHRPRCLSLRRKKARSGPMYDWSVRTSTSSTARRRKRRRVASRSCATWLVYSARTALLPVSIAISRPVSGSTTASTPTSGSASSAASVIVTATTSCRFETTRSVRSHSSARAARASPSSAPGAPAA